MSQGQIQRSSHYRNCQKGYSIFPPYNQRIVISIQSIAEPVFAKSELRGLGNTHAGTQKEPVCHFGRCNLNGLKEDEFAQAMMFPFSAPSLFPAGFCVEVYVWRRKLSSIRKRFSYRNSS